MRHSEPSRSSNVIPASPDNLARDFGPKADVACESVRTLCEVLLSEAGRAARAALERWRRLVTGAYGHGVLRSASVGSALAKCYGAEPGRLRPDELLFAVHTYYALVIKLLVWQTVACRHGVSTASDRLSRAQTSGGLRREVERLEAGGVEGMSLAAPLDDGLFSWYAVAWDAPVERLVRRLAERLRPYGARAIPDSPAGSRDLLKRLYTDLFPKPVRHALGEYYTPEWLAEHVLDEVGYRGESGARLLDPACGSGTFLVAAVNRVRARREAEGRGGRVEPGWLCQEILAGVVGFDLNPLAVLSARANYLIAICDLLGHADRVRLPVFLRDSILSPGDDQPGARFDFVVGNPPWIAWDDLPGDHRERHPNALPDEGGRRRVPPVSPGERRGVASRASGKRPGRVPAVSRGRQLDRHHRAGKRQPDDLSRPLRPVVPASQGPRAPD
jgi:hypothetical protein